MSPAEKAMNAARQEEFRIRRAMEGMAEVRGLYLPVEMHDTFKERARRLLSRNVAQRARRAAKRAQAAPQQVAA